MGASPQTLSQQDVYDLIQVREVLKQKGDPRADKVDALIQSQIGEMKADSTPGEVPSLVSGEYQGPDIERGNMGTIAPDESTLHALSRQALGGIGRTAKGLATFGVPTTKSEAAGLLIGGPIGVAGIQGFKMQAEAAQRAFELAKQKRYTEAAGHGLSAATPFAPMISSATERAVQGTVGPAAELATLAATPYAIKGALKGGRAVIEATLPVRQKIANRVAQSMLGPESEYTPLGTESGPALAAESPVALTRGSLIKKVGEALKSYQETINKTLKASEKSPPVSFSGIVRRGVAGQVKAGREAGRPDVARAIEKWANDYIAGKPRGVSVGELFNQRVKLRKALDLFRKGNANPDQVALIRAQEDVYRTMNDALDMKMPGFKAVTEREAGLINAREKLEAKVRAEQGGPILPTPRVYGGEGTGGTGFGAVRIGLPLPGETAIKTGLVRALGVKSPVGAPRPAAPAPPAPPILPVQLPPRPPSTPTGAPPQGPAPSPATPGPEVAPAATAREWWQKQGGPGFTEPSAPSSGLAGFNQQSKLASDLKRVTKIVEAGKGLSEAGEALVKQVTGLEVNAENWGAIRAKLQELKKGKATSPKAPSERPIVNPYEIPRKEVGGVGAPPTAPVASAQPPAGAPVAIAAPPPEAAPASPVGAAPTQDIPKGSDVLYQGVRAGNIKNQQGRSAFWTPNLDAARGYALREGKGGIIRVARVSDFPAEAWRHPGDVSGEVLLSSREYLKLSDIVEMNPNKIIGEYEIPSAPPSAAPEKLAASRAKVEGKAKEPWEMTRDEYLTQRQAVDQQTVAEIDRSMEEWRKTKTTSHAGENTKYNKRGVPAAMDKAFYAEKQRDLIRRHQQAVEQALSEGKPVPPEVLKDYPDLAAKPEGVSKPSLLDESKARFQAAKEQAHKRTGLTGTQEDYLAGKLKEVAPKLKSEGAYHPGEKFLNKQTIAIPGDGKYTVSTTEQANALHQAVAGEPLPGMLKPKNVPRIATGEAHAALGGPTKVAANEPLTVGRAIEIYGSREKALKSLKAQRAAVESDPESYPGFHIWELDEVIDKLKE